MTTIFNRSAMNNAIVMAERAKLRLLVLLDEDKDHPAAPSLGLIAEWNRQLCLASLALQDATRSCDEAGNWLRAAYTDIATKPKREGT